MFREIVVQIAVSVCVCVCPGIRTWLASQNVRVVPTVRHLTVFRLWTPIGIGLCTSLLENTKTEQMSALLSLRVETIPNMKK